jgi:feruloyl esterase
MIGVLGTVLVAASLQAIPCENLTKLELERATVRSAQLVPAGPFVLPEGASLGPGPHSDEPLPTHCRIVLHLTPTHDSNINAELWLPVENWNNRFLAVGNGGWAGAIQGWGDMQAALRRGYATAGSDTGHSGTDGEAGMFALGHPEKIVDFAYRALHDMTVKSKQILQVFYQQPLDYSFYKGCSTGGRMGVMAAQRYPGDYDGIIAGALANRHIHMHTAAVAQSIRLARHPAEAISAEQAKRVNDFVMEQCDTLQEGFLNNPTQCTVDFSSLQCRGGNTDDCLTGAQLRTVEGFYDDLTNSKGELIFSGQALGNDIPPQPSAQQAPREFVWDTVRILGFQDADLDWRSFDLDRDMRAIDAAAGFVDAVDPDLRAFKAHGGKLLMYHGWGDYAITPKNTILYYESVLQEMGEGQDDWMRLFMVPGMGHCRGGDGPHSFDSLDIMEQWRAAGVIPAQIPADNPQSGLSRPLCPYPQYARYDGSGDLKDSENWTCSAD